MIQNLKGKKTYNLRKELFLSHLVLSHLSLESRYITSLVTLKFLCILVEQIGREGWMAR
jgi:hypothetical protein